MQQRVSAAAVVGYLLFAANAHGADRNTGDAPSVWVTAPCNAQVVAGPNVCVKAGNQIECDLDHGTGSWPPAVYGVSEWGGSGPPYVFYGNNRNNDKFCCAFTNSPAVRFIFYYGSGLDDTLWFRGHDEAYWLEYAGGSVEFQLGMEQCRSVRRILGFQPEEF